MRRAAVLPDGRYRRRGRPRAAWGAALLVVAVLLAVAWYYQAVALAWQWAGMAARAERWREVGIWLPDYRASIDALPIEGLSRNASGLTFNPDTGTLFTVINQPPQVAELSVDGKLLRIMPVAGVSDIEGITHVEKDVYVLADERTQQLYRVNIGAETTQIETAGRPRLGLAIDVNGNLGFEGVSWDERLGRLWVAKEKSPLRVLFVDGLEPLLNGSAFDLQIREWRPAGAGKLFVRDLSSLTLHDATGHLLLLSDESKMVVEYAADGTPVSLLPLWRGWHGLRRGVPQPEGVALDGDGNLYVLSEPNLFYRFERDRAPRWSRDEASVPR